MAAIESLKTLETTLPTFITFNGTRITHGILSIIIVQQEPLSEICNLLLYAFEF